MLYGKILPNIADFDADDGHEDIDSELADTDSFYTSESLKPSLNLPSDPVMASDGEYYSAVLPLPPRRKRNAGSIIFLPPDALGTCP